MRNDLWYPSVGGGGLSPGGSKRIAYEGIYKDADEQEVIVYWWQAIMKDEERDHGQIHALILEL